MLRRLGFHLPVGHRGNQGQVDEQHPLPAQIVDKLSGGFEEGNRLYIADRATDLYDRHIHVGLLTHPEYPGFDFVGDMGDDLHGAS